MESRHCIILIVIFVSLVLHAVVALRCYNCHYAYHVKKDESKEFTDSFFNERDPTESRLHKDCGDEKPPDALLVTCPPATGKGVQAVCWMGVFNSSITAGVARGCDTTTGAEVKRSKQKLNSCWPVAKSKDEGGIAIDKISCYCNSTDGCSDWTYPGQKSGHSIKRMLSGATGATVSPPGEAASGGLYTFRCLTTIAAIFLGRILLNVCN